MKQRKLSQINIRKERKTNRFFFFGGIFSRYQQRLKQIAIYMKPIFELDEILQQDIHEDGQNECFNEHPTTPIVSIIKLERPRTYSDSSMTSIDGDENTLTTYKKNLLNRTHLNTNSLLTTNEPQPLFSNDNELYGTQLVNPLSFFSSSSSPLKT